MKYRVIRILDWIDAHILKHRFYWVCKKIGFSFWWKADKEIQNPFRRWHILEGKVVKVAAVDASIDNKSQSHFICTGDNDERVINKAIEQLDCPEGNWDWREIRRKREWRWPWQPEVKITKLGEGGTVFLQEGLFSIGETIKLDNNVSIVGER